MNILVIGNGFDLAHGLPTRYQEFLEFVEYFKRKFIEKKEILSFEAFNNINNHKKYLKHFDDMSNDRQEEFINLIKDNVWFKHFKDVYEEKLIHKQNWIDFESEISDVIHELDRIRKELSKIKQEKKETDDSVSHGINTSYEIIYKTPNKLINKLPDQKYVFDVYRLRKIKEVLLNDLNRLTRCFELYLNDFINYDECEVNVLFRDINPDFVLNFNYTNTFNKVYKKWNTIAEEEVQCNYIHGKARDESELKEKATDELTKALKENRIINDNEKFKNDYKVNSCDFVLGIEEYLEGAEKNNDNEYIEFKKFYQRIYKRTGSKYTNWLKNFSGNTYIFGHSLAATDKDIIKNIIEGSKMTTIYYNSQEALHDIILNLVQIIGEEELIERTADDNKSIDFVYIADAIKKAKEKRTIKITL